LFQLVRGYRQVLYWFDVKGDIQRYTPDHFPVFLWESPTHHDTYGFPAIDGPRGGLKIAFEDYQVNTTPEKVDRTISKEETQRMYDVYIKDYFPELSSTCLRAISCLYTVTPDNQFVIDKHPQYSNVIIASPCSGHGFKHSAAIGETLAELALEGKSTLDISQFGLSRFRKGIDSKA
jgi:sarcosine oxidase